MHTHTYCRLCEGSCGLLVEQANGRITSLRGDPSDPVSEGFICDTARAAPAAMQAPGRITRPMKRVNGQLQPASWEEALQDIGARLKAIRGQGGPRAVGLYMGPEVEQSGQGFVRSLAFALAMGTPNLFSDLAQRAGPRVGMAERMIGHPLPLMADLSRAHFVMLLGADQPSTDWGPWNHGMAHHAWLKHSRKTKGTKVITVDPRNTPLAAEMDQHLQIRPGTEPWLLLGMLAAAVKGNWRDVQYVDDYTTGYEELVRLLEPWSLERCAAICGIDPAVLSGLTLKLCRAAMAVIHPGPSTFVNAHPSVTAWALLALHTITANTLRPGGLYDHQSLFDLHYPMALVPSKGAPRTRVGDLPLLLLQAPSALLADEVLQPGEGQLKALITVAANPACSLPGSARSAEALRALELLVCLARQEDETTAHAHWVLPLAHPFEREDAHILGSTFLPRHMTAWTPAVVPPAGEARDESQILRDLLEQVKPGLRGSVWGPHLRLLGQYLGRAELAEWQKMALEWGADLDWSAMDQPPHRLDRGDANRAIWRPTTPDGRIHLVPEGIRELLAQVKDPVADPRRPLFLRSSRRPGRAADRGRLPEPGVGLHSSHNLPSGSRVRLTTAHGSVVAQVVIDDSLRPDTVDLPGGWGTEAMALVSASQLDPWTGTPCLDGLACSIEKA